MNEGHMHHNETESSAVEYAKFTLVIFGILATSIALSYSVGDGGLQDWMRWFMGVFFVVFAGFKFVGYKMFATMFAGYDVVAKRSTLYAYVYPFIELVLGLAYLFNFFGVARDAFTVVIMFVSAIGVYTEFKKRSGIHCACLGNVIKLPLSTTSLVEDLAMGLMALIMLILA